MKLRAVALLTRALRIEARSGWTYLLRVGLVGVLMLTLYATWQGASFGGAPGLRFFELVMLTNLAILTLAGLGFFASAVSEEREAQTLGLLRMTGLTPLVILLGKSTSRLLKAVGLLLVQMPFALLAVSLGGMMPRQIVASYIALGAYLVLLANLALLFSVVVRRTYQASVLTGAALIGLAILCAQYPWLSLFPIERLDAVLSVGWSGALTSLQTWTSLGVGAGLFVLAWMLFDLCTREASPAGPGRGLVPRRRLRRLAPGRSWSGASSVAWKDYHFYASGPVGAFGVVLLIAVACAIAGWFLRRDLDSWTDVRRIFSMVFITASAVLIWLGAGRMAARVLQEELRARTLPALSLTRLSFAQILGNKALAVLLATVPAFAFLAAGIALIAPDWLWGMDVGLWTALSIWVSVLIHFSMYLLLVAYFALRVRHGAVILALFAHMLVFHVWGLFALMLSLPAFFLGGPTGVMLWSATMCVPISALAAAGIRRRLGLAVAA